MTMLLNMLTNMLRVQNPQAYQTFMQMKQSGANPQGIMQQMLGNATPNQMQNVMQMGKQYGVPNDVLAQIQNMTKS